ncbi:hypothetical protein ACFX12_028348 [Malus domestica]
MVAKRLSLISGFFCWRFCSFDVRGGQTQWVDDKNDMVIEFEFDDQPVVYMKYSANAKPMIICKATKQNLGIILNCELTMWSVQDFNEVDEVAI